MAGLLWLEAGDPRQAAARFSFARQQADLDESGDPQLAVDLGIALVTANEPLQAIEVLRTVPREAAPAVLARTHSWLGRAYSMVEEWDEAARSWDEALGGFLELGLSEEAAEAAYQEGRLAEREGVLAAAVELFEKAAELADEVDAEQLVHAALSANGSILARFGDQQAIEVFEQAIDYAEQVGFDWGAADARDGLARALATFDRSTEAVPVALQAADAYRAADDPASAGGAEHLAGQILLALGRGAEAVGVLRSALEAPERRPGFLDAVRVQLADALDAAGEPQEAAELRRQVEGSISGLGE